MKEMKKRMIALLLTLCMVISLMPVSVFAAEPAARIDITQDIPADALIGTRVPVTFTLTNRSNAEFKGIVAIRFQGSNEDQGMFLIFEDEKLNVSERIVDGHFLGYDIKAAVPAGETFSIKADAVAEVEREYKFKTLTSMFTAGLQIISVLWWSISMSPTPALPVSW